MNKRIIISLCAVFGGVVQGLAQERPNIIYILADDMGYGDVGALNPNSQIKTPNLDKLRNEGMAFMEAHSGSSLSTPTRYGILTGQYCFRSELKSGVLNGFSPMLIAPEIKTVADVLSDAGYKTGIVGKWHIGLDWQAKDKNKPLTRGKGFNQKDGNVDFKAPLTSGPHTKGFDYSYIMPASLDIPPYVYIEDGKVENKNIITLDGYGSLSAKGYDARGVFWRTGSASDDFNIRKTLDHFTSKALAFIEENSKSEQPFFLYFPLTAPHTPWLPAEEYMGKSGAGRYGDFVCHLDDVVGQVMQLLEQKGISENTIVVFTSDNGAYWTDDDKEAYPQHSANYLYRGVKADIWDGGHHIPFIVRWPSKVSANSSSEQLVCLTDLMATAADIAGTKVPSGQGEDSRSFYNALLGRKKYEGMRESVIHHSGPGMFAIRRGDWKFIDGQGSGGRSTSKQDVPEALGQLYDMKKDVSEQQNLYNKEPKVVKSLQEEMEGIKISGFGK